MSETFIVRFWGFISITFAHYDKVYERKKLMMSLIRKPNLIMSCFRSGCEKNVCLKDWTHGFMCLQLKYFTVSACHGSRSRSRSYSSQPSAAMPAAAWRSLTALATSASTYVKNNASQASGVGQWIGQRRA